MASNAVAQLDYGFTVSSGERMEGEFEELQNGSRAGACQTQGGDRPSDDMIKIGFPFQFDGVFYEELNVNSNGFLSLGGTLDSPGTNDLDDASVAVLAPFWDVMRLPGGENGCNRSGIIRYALMGDEPNRILVVDFYDPSLGDGCTDRVYVPVQFQVRLYEGTNRIEFYYGEMDPNSPDCFGGSPAATSASIGLASPNGVLSLTPQGGTAIGNSNQDVASVDLQEHRIDRGTVYGFCPAQVIGDVDQGGTPRMQDGDVLFEETELMVYNSQTFQPFTFISPCASQFSYSITGPNADEYSIDPIDGTLDPDKGNTPTIRFRPTGTGVRSATLTIRDESGYVARSYQLVGEGTARVVYVGNVDQGGTAELKDGDVLMNDIKVRNGSSGDFTPITIQILPDDGEGAPSAPVTYTLIDPTGQFSIDRTSEDVAPGGSSTPVITFAPRGNVDFQSARLIVDAEGIRREFILRPFSSGPGARFSVGGETFVNGSAMLREVYGCVGESNFNVAFRIDAIGDEPFIIEDLAAFQVNPDVVQGNPPAPLVRDPFGDPVKVADYYVAGSPNSDTPLEFPIILNPGETRTLYVTFAPIRPGKRAARTFFQTNGENFNGYDLDRGVMRGMLNMELVGRGIGGVLSGQGGIGLPKPIVFAHTDVRDSSTATGYVRNTGECVLRIKKDQLRIVSGDVNEFSIRSAFANSSVDPATGDYLITPGGMDSVVVGFTPTRSGSRRASLRLTTNDSLVYVGGVVARGEYYIDLFGVGNVGIEARPVVLAPAILDGPSSSGQALLENTSAELLEIVKIEMLNGNGEIIEDATRPWPVLPLQVVPGQKIPLGLAFVPNTANGPGERTAMIRVTLSNGNILTVDVRGLAGTRTLTTTPAALFQGAKVPVGEARRAYALLTNSGTFPVMIQSYQVTGPNKDDYRVGNIARAMLEPGETLPIDVVYTPTTPGTSTAMLEFVTNSTNGTPVGTHVVVLGGEGTSTSMGGGDPQSSTQMIPTTGEQLTRPEAANRMASGNRLYNVAPNPVTGTATFRFSLAAESAVELGVYDVNSGLVRNLVTGMQSAGEGSVKADLTELPAGSYYVRLNVEGHVLTQVITVVK